MDAVENLSGLNDAPRFAARDLLERVLSGPVNAGEPQDGDAAPVRSPMSVPGLLGGKPRVAPRH